MTERKLTVLSIQGQLKQAQKTGDFSRACRLLAAHFTLTAGIHQQQHEAALVAAVIAPDLVFWPGCARRAEQAGRIYRHWPQEALPEAVAGLRAANLWDFAEALETGVYLDLSF